MNDLMLPNPLISSFSTGQSDLKSIKQFQIDALNASQQSLFHLAITESKRLNELSAKIAACPVAEDSALAKIKELIAKKVTATEKHKTVMRMIFSNS